MADFDRKRTTARTLAEQSGRFKYHYRGIGGCDCQCDLEIYGNLVVCSERNDNKGTSVSNWAEHLATEVCQRYGIDPDALIWVERYPDRGHFNERTGEWQLPEDFSLAVFKRKEKTEWQAGNLITSIFSAPKWRPLDKETVQGLIEAHTTKPETLKHWTDKVKAIAAAVAQAPKTGLPSSYFQ